MRTWTWATTSRWAESLGARCCSIWRLATSMSFVYGDWFIIGFANKRILVQICGWILNFHHPNSYQDAVLLAPPPTLTFHDQFAFHPTGSTTAALVSILHVFTSLLTANSYVTVIASDFSKDFDTVRHSAVLQKLAQLHVPGHIFNWIWDYLKDQYCTVSVKEPNISIISFFVHHSMVFYFRCSIYTWKGSVRF